MKAVCRLPVSFSVNADYGSTYFLDHDCVLDLSCSPVMLDQEIAETIAIFLVRREAEARNVYPPK